MLCNCTLCVSVHRLRHATHAGWEAQVLPVSRGVHLRSAQPVPGHCQPLPLHPLHHRPCTRLDSRDVFILLDLLTFFFFFFFFRLY